MHRARRVVCLGLGMVCLAFAGCGSRGPVRHRIQGTVTFQDKPVAFGAIFFEPTASVGKIAPTVYLPVRNGKYDTGAEGPTSGKYTVRVGGQDKTKERVDDDGITHTAQLFNDHVFEVTIPPPDNVLNITVPSIQPPRQP